MRRHMGGGQMFGAIMRLVLGCWRPACVLGVAGEVAWGPRPGFALPSPLCMDKLLFTCAQLVCFGLLFAHQKNRRRKTHWCPAGAPVILTGAPPVLQCP